jgi:hypothetical protein
MRGIGERRFRPDRGFAWGFSLCVAAVLGAPQSVPADLIAYWDFNDSNLVIDQGAGMLTTNFPAVDVSYSAGTTKNAQPGVLAGQSLTVRNQANNGVAHADFAVSTAGYTGILLSLATQKTSTGFNANDIAYSVDGGANFTIFGAPYNPPTAFDSFVFDLSSISGLNDNPQAVFRIAFAGATSATGNNRLDNILISGTQESVAIPEPTAGWLTILVAGLVARWRAVAGRWRLQWRAIVSLWLRRPREESIARALPTR